MKKASSSNIWNFLNQNGIQIIVNYWERLRARYVKTFKVIQYNKKKKLQEHWNQTKKTDKPNVISLERQAIKSYIYLP